MSASSGFDPGGVAQQNGRYFGFPYGEEEASVVILPAPWDVTTSYRDGTSRGPAAVLDASPQLDFTSPLRPRAWETRIGTAAADPTWLARNGELRPQARLVIEALERGEPAPAAALSAVNEGGAWFHQALEQRASAILARGQRVITLGGDHSVSLGPIRAHGAHFGAFSVLHIDAHADLRVAYEGFAHSHASIMHHVQALPFIDRLVQVGLRDYSPEEEALFRESAKIRAFTDWDLRRETAAGRAWDQQCRKILEPLGPRVYVSVDVDGLDPRYCPSTGTPVPGGLEWWEMLTLFDALKQSGREIIGADIVEVAPGETEWDANVGARILFQLCQLVAK